MKKLMTLMLGVALAFGSAAATFIQTDTNMQSETLKKKGKKNKPDTTTTKKERFKRFAKG